MLQLAKVTSDLFSSSDESAAFLILQRFFFDFRSLSDDVSSSSSLVDFFFRFEAFRFFETT
jgi:hypothetical protein